MTKPTRLDIYAAIATAVGSLLIWTSGYEPMLTAIAMWVLIALVLIPNLVRYFRSTCGCQDCRRARSASTLPPSDGKPRFIRDASERFVVVPKGGPVVVQKDYP